MRRSVVCLLTLLALVIAVPAQGQIKTTTFRFLLSPSQESPATTSMSSGWATIQIRVDEDTAVADFRVDYAMDMPKTAIGMHIHRAERGENGPVVVNSQLGSNVPLEGEGSLFRSVEVTDLDLIDEILANPDGFYLNVHTTDNPSGEFRGQLGDSDGATKADVDRLTEQLAALQAQLNNIGRVLGIRPQ